MNKTIQTYSQIYQDYASRNTMNPQIESLLVKFMPLLSGKKILDIGCANGRDSEYLSAHGYEVTGIDLTPEFITLAKANCPKCDFKVMDMRQLDFEPHSFDGLWICASFLHITKAQASSTLKGFHNVLKPGGVMFIAVFEGDFEGLRPNDGLKWPERHFSDYKPEEFKNLLIQNHFEVIDFVAKETQAGMVFINFFCKAI